MLPCCRKKSPSYPPCFPGPLQVLGPTLGLVAFVAGGIFYWPVGGVVWCMNHVRGRALMHQPSILYSSTKNTIPI